MIVPMMSIREMRMRMCLLLVRMPMSALDPWFHQCVMFVLAVFVMDMLVFMLQRLELVFMFVMLRQV